MQAIRDFWRFHFLKVLLGLVAIQLVIVAWLQVRNHRPEAILDEVYVVEGQSVKIQPTRNDTDKDDEDMDSLKIVNFGTPIKGELQESGKYLLYEAVYGYVGIDSFPYVISDGKKESKQGWVRITIDENKSPVANNDYLQMYAGTKLNIDVLANDEDQEGDSIFITEFTKPLVGDLQQIDGKFVYKPSAKKAVIDSFQYVLSDGYTNSEQATVIIDVKDKSYECYPWLNVDVGNIEHKGSVKCQANDFVVYASGADIWDRQDGFNYTYQLLKGDFEITVKVKEQENTHEWAKTGVMVRENLSNKSRNVFAFVTAQHGLGFQRRSDQGSYTEGLGGKEGVNAPYWIKLQRKGNEFKATCSVNGTEWENFGQCDLELPNEIYLGLAHTSHDNSKNGKAVFSNVKVK